MSDEKGSEKSKFADLLQELYGVQLASKMVEEMWSHASLETKKALADKLLTAAIESVDKWAVKSVVESATRELLQVEVARLGIETVVVAAVQSLDLKRIVGEQVDALVKSAVEFSLREVRDRLTRAGFR